MKAYCVYGKDNKGEMAELIFAYNQNQAKSKGFHNMEACRGFDYIEIHCHRVPEADTFVNKNKIESYVEYDPEILRNSGFYPPYGEDPESCDSCGLASYGFEKYAICPDCRQCKECGCDCEEIIRLVKEIS